VLHLGGDREGAQLEVGLLVGEPCGDLVRRDREVVVALDLGVQAGRQLGGGADLPAGLRRRGGGNWDVDDPVAHDLRVTGRSARRHGNCEGGAVVTLARKEVAGVHIESLISYVFPLLFVALGGGVIWWAG
jgi:hypothetical protein